MATMETTSFTNMNEVKAANRAAGFHFFDADTMAFFDSRVESSLIGGRFFVTSEQFHGSTEDGPRQFTIREAKPDGSIDELGEFQEYEDVTEAIEAAEAAAGIEGEEEGDEDIETLEDVLDSGDFPGISDLWRWSSNWQTGEGPATLFLDLIGYSVEEFGEPMYDMRNASLGYLELSKLASALEEYATSPTGAEWFVRRLLELEAGE